MAKVTQYVGFQMEAGILLGVMEEAESRGIGYTTLLREIIAYATKGGTDFSVLPATLPRVYRRKTAADVRREMNEPSEAERFIAGVRADRARDMAELDADIASRNLPYDDPRSPEYLPPDWETRDDRFTNPASPDFVPAEFRMVNSFAAPAAPTYPTDNDDTHELSQMAGVDNATDQV